MVDFYFSITIQHDFTKYSFQMYMLQGGVMHGMTVICQFCHFMSCQMVCILCVDGHLKGASINDGDSIGGEVLSTQNSIISIHF